MLIIPARLGPAGIGTLTPSSSMIVELSGVVPPPPSSGGAEISKVVPNPNLIKGHFDLHVTL